MPAGQLADCRWRLVAGAAPLRPAHSADPAADTIFGGSSGKAVRYTRSATDDQTGHHCRRDQPGALVARKRRSGCRVDSRRCRRAHHMLLRALSVDLKTDPITGSSGTKRISAPAAGTAAAARDLISSALTMPSDRGWPGRHRYPIDEVRARSVRSMVASPSCDDPGSPW